MTYIEAAIEILRESEMALTTRELTDAAMQKGLFRPRGKTPIATMSAALYLHVSRTDRPLVRREFRPGTARAVRDSVRWRFAG